MNIGIIATPNTKGQIVIPSAMRKALGISHDTVLRIKIVGEGIYMQPTRITPRILGDNSAFMAVLKKVQGSWGQQTPQEKRQEKAQRKLELAASRSGRNVW